MRLNLPSRRSYLKSTIRINDLARELGAKSRTILRVLPELGIASEGRSHSSSLKEFEATIVRMHFHAAIEAAPQSPQKATAPSLLSQRGKGKNAKTLAAPERKKEKSGLGAIQTSKVPQTHLATKHSRGEDAIVDRNHFKRCPHCNVQIKSERFTKHTKSCLQKLQAFQNRLSKCPVCHCSYLKHLLPAHMTKSHGQTYGTPGNLPIHIVMPEPHISLCLSLQLPSLAQKV